LAKPNTRPTPHAFALERLLGQSDLQVMRRYLAQNNTDIQPVHLRNSPVHNAL
jgi:hypothetical protein